MPTPQPEYPQIDFAMDAVPDLHAILADLRERYPIAPIRYHGQTAYLITRFEDLKPAGFEPMDVKSGGKGQEGFWSYMELRDEKVAFFVRSLQQGEHLMRYRLRAEIPGVFHALPTRVFAMYVPELKANGEEQVIKIVD